MDNPFSRPKLIYKLKFDTFYKYVEQFENFFAEENIGISSFEVESKTIDAKPNDIWCIEIYLATKPDKNILNNVLKYFAKHNNLEILNEVKVFAVKDKGWVKAYQKQLSPIIVGKFFIAPFAQANKCPQDHTHIIIEASRAFGSGEHATTSGCLEALEELSDCNFTTIFDIGTGSGILSFACAKLWPKAEILACDIDETSIEVAKFNHNFNDSNIHFFQNSSEGLSIPINHDRSFDLIVSNILAKPLINLAHNISFLLKHHGHLILSGFLDYRMNEIIAVYKNQGIVVDKIIQKNELIILVMHKD